MLFVGLEQKHIPNSSVGRVEGGFTIGSPGWPCICCIKIKNDLMSRLYSQLKDAFMFRVTWTMAYIFKRFVSCPNNKQFPVKYIQCCFIITVKPVIKPRVCSVTATAQLCMSVTILVLWNFNGKCINKINVFHNI